MTKNKTEGKGLTELLLESASISLNWSSDAYSIPHQDEELTKIVKEYTILTVKKFNLPEGVLGGFDADQSENESGDEEYGQTAIVTRIEADAIYFELVYPIASSQAYALFEHALDILARILSHSAIQKIESLASKVELRLAGEPDKDVVTEASALATQLSVSPPVPIRRKYEGLDPKHIAVTYFSSHLLENPTAFLIASHVVSKTRYTWSIAISISKEGIQRNKEISEKLRPAIKLMVEDANSYFFKTHSDN